MVVSERASHWDYFHLLGSVEDKHKFNYAVKLYLLFVDDGSDEGTREYILSRVIQALGALSNNMRAGAFSLLCTLLVNNPQQCSYDTIKKLVNNSLKPSGTMKADAEAYVGQFLAIKAVIQSKLLDKTPALYSEVADVLMELSMKKSYLHADALSLLSQITIKTGQEYGNDVFFKHLKDLNNGTLDKLNYLLKLDLNLDDSETLTHVFDGNRLLSTEIAAEIGILLAKCSDSSHKFIKAFLEAIAENHKYVSKLWKSYEQQVKEKLNTNKVVLEMYYSLLSQTLQQMLTKKQYKTIRTIVSDVAIASLLKNSKSKSELTKETCKSISEILNSANNSALSLEILNKLVFSSGTFSFDEDTGTRLVGSVWRTLATEETKDFGIKCLEAAVNGEGVKNKDRNNALNIYCSLLNKPACQLETEWRIEGMKTLLKAGLVSGEQVSSELATIIRKAFFNTLSIKFPTLPDYATALKELVKCLDKCLSKESSLRIKITDEMKSSWKLSQKLISSLEKSVKRAKEENKIIINALELVTCFIALKSLYEPKESQFNLTDIQSVLQRITKSDDSSEGPEWIEVVMDLFLNMLSKPNVSNRTIINTVFKTMVPHLNNDAFSQMIDVLDPSYDLNKAEPSDAENEEEENSENESDEGGDESEEQSSADEEEYDDEEEDNEDEETEEDEMDDEDTNSRAFNQEKLQFDLRKALTPADNSDNESINIDDLDEEQGKQLDATLSAIFKNAMVKKKPSKRESITSHFRTRVIDLLETYCLSGMPLDHWLTLIPSVLKLANSIVSAKNAAGLKQRLMSFIRKISTVKIADITSENCDINSLVELLQELITQASNASGTALDLKQHYLEFIKFCVRNTNHAHARNVASLKESLNNVVCLAIENFFCEKSSLPLEVVMFLCQYNWCGVHNLVHKIVELSFSTSTKSFKRTQGINLLKGYFKSDRLFHLLADSEAKTVKAILNSLLNGIGSIKSEGLLDQKTQHLVTELIIEMHEGKGSSYVKWKKWKDQLPQLFSEPTDRKFNKLFETLCRKFDLKKDSFTESSAASTDKKGKGDQTQGATNNRKRKQVDARKLKKESKRRRLAAMDGLDNLSWSKLAMDE